MIDNGDDAPPAEAPDADPNLEPNDVPDSGDYPPAPDGSLGDAALGEDADNRE